MSRMLGHDNAHDQATERRAGARLRTRAASVTGLLALTASALVATGGPARAVAPDFLATAGVYTVDTDALTLTGPGANFSGTISGSTAVFSFHTVDIPSGATVNAHGTRAFRLVASAGLTVAGVIDGSGASVTDQSNTTSAGGPGGGAGGAPGPAAPGAGGQPGGGPGGGGAAADALQGAGGGGFGGGGARGGLYPVGPTTGGTGGAAYGNLNVALQGGSGGGGGAIVGGGGGGGAIALYGASVTVTASGVVRADGGGGAVGGGGASGGGSGGGILIHATTVNVTGTLSAAGGDGGAGGCCGDGGAGGGGRIAYQYRTLLASGTTDVSGGDSGVRSTLGFFTHGGLSPDPTGATGVVTRTPVPNTTITGAVIRSAKHKATFRFRGTSLVTGFQCKLKRPNRTATFVRCSSPKTYLHLRNGRYVFSVRAFGPAGTDPTPAVKRFRIG